AGVTARYLALAANTLPGDSADDKAARQTARTIVLTSAQSAWDYRQTVGELPLFGPFWDRSAVVPTSAGLEAKLPVLRARLVPGPEAAGLKGREVVAFAGIACPRKFFDMIDEIGCRVVARHSFADHHLYTPGELAALLEEAAALGAVPATTAKDAVRLPPEVRAMVEVVVVSLAWQDPDALARVLRPVLDRG
ncbi:MAG: tetraacyldisaccharide 4'-kinase, partial [Proteobacteria bacterium]|nr:tetraacyldisaccharide 4'-kinase [Pseudomonadota bacterium]